MKLKIVIILLISFFSLAGFSQENQKAEKDSLASSLKSNLFENHADIKDLDTNNQTDNFPEIENPFKVLEFNIIPESDPKINFPLSENQNSFDNMPIYEPWVNNNMPIAVPDTTIDYKLKIKKYDGFRVRPNVR